MLRGDVFRSVADQGLWAIRSLILVVLIARSSTTEEFGIFGICFAILLFLSGLAVSLSGEVLAVTRGQVLRGLQASDDPRAEVAAATQRSLGMVIVVAFIAPILILAVGSTFEAGLRPSIWLLIVSSPMAILAEGARALNYATRQGATAAAVSMSWLVAQGLCVVVAALVVRLDALWVMLSWLFGASVAAVVGVLAVRVRPRFSGASRLERARRRQVCSEYVATTGPSHATVFLAGGFIGLAAAGSIRALQSLYGPLNVVLGGMANAIIPAKAQDPRRVTQTAALIATATVSIAAFATGVFALVPSIGQALMGLNWPDDVALVLGYGAGRCAQGVIFGAMVVYRAHDGGRYSWRLRLATAVAILAGFLLGAPGGLGVAVWASSVGALGAAVMWWVMVPRMSRAGPQRAALG